MKLVSFRHSNRLSFGALAGEGIVDFGLRGLGNSLRDYLERGLKDESGTADFALADVTLLPPIVEPRKIMCIGLNYRSHVIEAGRKIPQYPTVFFRVANSQVGHGGTLVRPKISEQYDFEGELAVVIGKGGRHIEPNRAREHVAGYVCYNDGSIRDWQRHSTQWGPGKNFTASGSCGPWLTTTDEIAEPARMELTTRVNGQLMQHGKIEDLIFDIPALMAYCSSFCELEAGDLIVTGTTGGVGGARNPPVWLRDGDLVEVAISGIGTLANRVVDEISPNA